MEGKSRSFTRKGPSASAGYVQSVGARPGSHGVSLVSSGLSDLDQIIGGGIPVGGLVMVMEDIEAPHHMLLLRYFMAQGLAHAQPLFFASPLPSPQAFLGTLPAIASGKESKGRASEAQDTNTQGELRIAWQYRRYLNEQQALEERRQRQQELATHSWSPTSSSFYHSIPGAGYEFCNMFDMRKPMERTMLTRAMVDCHSLGEGVHLATLRDHCKDFVAKLARPAGEAQQVGRLAFQSLCAPQCMNSCTDWEMLSFLQALKGMLRAASAVAIVTFPVALLKPSMAVRWQHFADILLSVEAVLDEDKTMADMLTDYQDILGFLRIHKLASINTQVPAIPEAATHAMKVVRKKRLVLERLVFAPVDATGKDAGNGGAAGLICGRPANAASPLDF